MLWFGPRPVAVPHFPLFFCLIYIYPLLIVTVGTSNPVSFQAWDYLVSYPVITSFPYIYIDIDTPQSTYLYSQYHMLNFKAPFLRRILFLHLPQVFFKTMEVNIRNMHMEV